MKSPRHPWLINNTNTKSLIYTIHGQPHDKSLLAHYTSKRTKLHHVPKQCNQRMTTPTLHMSEQIHKWSLYSTQQWRTHSKSNKRKRFFTLINAWNQASMPQDIIVPTWLLQCTCTCTPCTCLVHLRQTSYAHLVSTMIADPLLPHPLKVL